MNYTDLAAALGNILVVDQMQDADWANILPRVIEAGEFGIYRDCEFLATYKRSTSLAFTQNGTTSDALLTMPTDLVAIRSIAVITPTDRVELMAIADEPLRAYGGVSTTRGVPKYYCQPVFGTVQVALTPDSAYAVDLAYQGLPIPISAGNPTTWLSTYAPDLLLYGCLVFGAGYKGNYGASSSDPQMALSWKARYDEAKSSVVMEERRRKGQSQVDIAIPTNPGLNNA